MAARKRSAAVAKCTARPRGLPSAAPLSDAAALAWAVEYLPHHFGDQPCDLHRELLADLADESKRMLARVAPRGHGKTTCAALAFPLWCICEQKRRSIVIITHESSLATQFVRDIRSELESNERILDAYGNLCGDTDGAKNAKTAARRRVKWAESRFVTSSGVSMQARGAGAALRGMKVGAQRPDLIICDDIEKDARVESPVGRRKLERWMQRVVLPALAPGGRLLVLGSILHYDSLLANLRDARRFPGWDYRVYRALEATPSSDGRHVLTPLWPARWPVVRLEAERERIGTLAFEQEYQANPVDDARRAFREEWLRGSSPELRAGRELIPLVAVDPATGKTDGDFFALWAGGIDPATGVIHSLELTLERIGVVDQIKRIIAAFERYRPVRIGIETTAYQAALKDILDDEGRRRRLYLPIVGIQSATNKRARIEGSAAFYENGTFLLPPTVTAEIESQFLHFPKAKHDDAPDVCAMAIELARTLRAASIEVATGGRNAFASEGGW